MDTGGVSIQRRRRERYGVTSVLVLTGEVSVDDLRWRVWPHATWIARFRAVAPSEHVEDQFVTIFRAGRGAFVARGDTAVQNVAVCEGLPDPSSPS